jgi:hypothetical protein
MKDGIQYIWEKPSKFKLNLQERIKSKVDSGLTNKVKNL